MYTHVYRIYNCDDEMTYVYHDHVPNAADSDNGREAGGQFVTAKASVH
jgi:hypothetical protein